MLRDRAPRGPQLHRQLRRSSALNGTGVAWEPSRTDRESRIQTTGGFMKHSIIAAIAGLGLVAGSGLLFAQVQPPQPPPDAQQAEVGEQDVQKFAEIYVEIEKTRNDLSREMANAETQEEAQDIQARMQDEIIGKIEDSGWSMAQYNQVANAINNDPQLREQAINHIKQMGT
jgi:hypothetical protein